ncbi:MAG TPA: hypothetical protein VH025_03905, partial [Solirubrobacteraceae bacterium]|nr:hypothetical protein [Solirubrobacteraceae bacterium]
RVFDLERRIYRIDRLRLNPGGVPVRGVVYLLVLLAGALIATRLPLIGLAMRQMPWFVRCLGLPGLTAALLAVVRIEGRPFHVAARALIRHRMRRSGVAGAPAQVVARRRARRWVPPPLLMLADGSDGPRRLCYRGPGAALVAIAHERRIASGMAVRLGLRSDVRVSAARGGPPERTGAVIVLDRNARLTVR